MARRKSFLNNIEKYSMRLLKTEYAINLNRVKQCGTELEHITPQTTELCLEAVKQDGLAIAFVKNITHEIKLEAVRKNGLAVELIPNASPEIWFEAWLENKYVEELVPDKIKKTHEHKKLMIEHKLKTV